MTVTRFEMFTVPCKLELSYESLVILTCRSKLTENFKLSFRLGPSIRLQESLRL